MVWKVLLIAIIISLLFYKFSGQILRFVLRKAGKRLEREMKKRAEEAVKQAQQQTQQQAKNPTQTVKNEEGQDITVTYVHEPKRHATKDFTDGDYIDFEEVK